MARQNLRTGYTTGTCAAAAAKAGLFHLLLGQSPAQVDTPLPPGGHLRIPIHACTPEGDGVRVTVLKDGGDDPDCTNGEEIQVLVHLKQGEGELEINLNGGKGIGRVTLPGLPVPVGQAAINPTPKSQIETALREAAGDWTGTISVLVEVPRGEELAAQTMNPRLGILGGISILGTQGIVKPYSNESYTASIAEALDVAQAAGLTEVVFTTGRRTERLYLEYHPETNPLAAVQVADFFAFANKAAALRGFTDVTWSVFFGKLVKQAQGLTYTHAKTHPVDFDLLARRCAEAGVGQDLLPAIQGANTARQVLDTLHGNTARDTLLLLLINLAEAAATTFAGSPIHVSYSVFDFDGSLLA